jgi:hypothetical protein
LRRRLPPDRSLVATAIAGASFLVAWGLIHRGFWAQSPIIDTPTYQRYGDAIVHGRLPYRDFSVEYPPGALPVFAFPSLFDDYATAFAWLMAFCGVLLVAAVSLMRTTAALYVAISPLLVGSLMLSRFDLWPALLTAAALAALLGGHDRLGWGLLGGAVAAKVWPAVLVPVVATWAWRRRRLRAAWVGVLVLAICVVPFALLAPHGLWASVRGQASRPLQIESLAASVLTAFGDPHVITTHGSQNIAGHGNVSFAIAALQLAALLAIWIGFARGPATDDRMMRYSAASVCAFIAFGKVLSPQFLIWLVPLVPLVRGMRGAVAVALLTAALILTQVWFPRRYWDYVYGHELAGVVFARDLVLVALVAVLALPARAAKPARP